MKQTTLLLIFCLYLMHQAQARKVKFSVDMTSTAIHANGVHLAGNFNNVNYDSIAENPLLINWDTTSYLMSNNGSGNIYSITLDLVAGIAYEFKYINGNSWPNVETVPALSQVSGTVDNRWVYIPNDLDTFMLPAFRFSQNAPMGKVAVALSVDMRDLPFLTAGTLIAGSFNAFVQTPISNYIESGNMGGSVFRTLIYPDTQALVLYKFLNGTNGWEEVPARCGNGSAYNDRVFVADSNKTIAKTCFSQCTICTYPNVGVDTAQFANALKLSSATPIDSSDYVHPVFRNATYTDTVMVSGLVLFNPALYGLSASRKASYIQRKGGGPWSGIQIMLEPAGSSITLATYNSEIQFYNKTKRWKNLSVKGVIRQFQNETQLNILRNGTDSSIVALNATGFESPIYSTIPIRELMLGGAGGASVGVQQKHTGEKWEGVYVQLNNVVVDTVYASGASRFLWKLKDYSGNAIWMSDFSAFFRNDNNEDSAIANTFAPPLRGQRLQFVRGIVEEALLSGVYQYQLAPLYPEDIGAKVVFPFLPIDSIQFVNNTKLSLSTPNDLPDYVSPIFANPIFADTISTSGVVLVTPRVYGLSTNRKSTFLQRQGGGAWSGVELMCDTASTIGFSKLGLLNNTQFYNKNRAGNLVRVNGLMKEFSSQTQLNILPNGLDSSLIILDTNKTIVITPIPISELMIGGQEPIVGVQQKTTGEKWEGAYVQINNVSVDTVYPLGSTRFAWKVKDAMGNAIWIRDYSAFFRNDDNEDSLIANTFAPPIKGSQLSFIKGVVMENIQNGILQYTLAPLYPNDLGPINPIPVKLLYFNANKRQEDVLLNWATASETNNSHFEIERSADNKTYETIGLQKGNGNSAVASKYLFMDDDALLLLKNNKRLYYRLKQVDNDNKYEYSNSVIVSTVTSYSKFEIWPNPASTSIQISGITNNATIRSVAGKVVMTISNNGFVDVSNLAQGIYFITTDNHTLKFVKQ